VALPNPAQQRSSYIHFNGSLSSLPCAVGVFLGFSGNAAYFAMQIQVLNNAEKIMGNKGACKLGNMPLKMVKYLLATSWGQRNS
jgi:hypothetical protein